MENALHQVKVIIASHPQPAVVPVVRHSHIPRSKLQVTSYFHSKKVPVRSRLTEVFLGVTMPLRCTMMQDISFFDNSLNDSQKAAVRFALESADVACIHGPPGEGTWKLLCIPALMHEQVQEKPTRSLRLYGNSRRSLLSIPGRCAYWPVGHLTCLLIIFLNAFSRCLSLLTAQGLTLHVLATLRASFPTKTL